MSQLTKEEERELKILEDPNVQYSTPATAFYMGAIYNKKRKLRLLKLKAKQGDKDAIKKIATRNKKNSFLALYYILLFIIFYFLAFLLNYGFLGYIYLIAFVFLLIIPLFINKDNLT